MCRHVLRTGICGSFILLTCLAHEAVGKGPAGKGPAVGPDQLVQEVLRRETDENEVSVDRRDLLKPETNPHTLPLAWWQAGYVQIGKLWRPYEESIATDSAEELLNEYRDLRAAMSNKPGGHWKLANWCKKHDLSDQERYHLLKVLETVDPSVARNVVYERLKCELVGDKWVSPQERRDIAASEFEVELSHKLWDAKLKGAIALLQGTPKQRATAEKQLAAITSATAVPSIVALFCSSTPNLAEYGLRTLSQIREFQAARAIAGQAVFSPHKPIRQQAIESLKGRPLKDYVPDLTLVLSNPLKTKINIVTDVTPGTECPHPYCTGSVRINLDYVWTEETHDTVQTGARRLYSESFRPLLPKGMKPFSISSELRPNDRQLPADGANFQQPDVAEQKDILDLATADENEARKTMNERVGRILSSVTALPYTADPKVWWDWWKYYSIEPAKESGGAGNGEPAKKSSPMSRTITQPSGLASGTAVWTERGRTPIEQIEPGDRVLAKEITSGELAYKPVLFRDAIDASAVREMRIAQDQISSSSGHHFWRDGIGWTKFIELSKNEPLHTATGMKRIIERTDEGLPTKVYNLVVADFHTFFVGQEMVLCHDAQNPELTNFKVPGLRTH